MDAIRTTAPARGEAMPVALAQGAQVHVVDDDATVRTALCRLLRSHGYEAIEHPSAETFLARRDPHTHGCILLDVSLPGLDGPGLQRTLLEQGDALPIIFLTGLADVPT